MNRDALPQRVIRRNVTARASANFAYLAEAIARAYEPTSTQLQDLERAYNATGEYLIGCDEFAGLLTQVHAHGSRALGTIVRPIDANRDGFDIDLVARLSKDATACYGGPGGASLMLTHLFNALRRYAHSHSLEIKQWERCVTLFYANGMQADFAPVVDDPMYSLTYGEHHGRIPDRDLQRYVSTNPKGYSLGFDEAAKIKPVFYAYEALSAEFAEASRAEVEPLPEAHEVFERLLSRFVQLAKVHRNISFLNVPAAGELTPPSMFLTSLIAKAFATLAPQPHDGPLDLFLDIVDFFPKLIQCEVLLNGREYWILMNPFAQNDNLAVSMNTPERQQAFRQWHSKLTTDLERLLAAIEGNQGIDAVTTAVTHAFGQRATQAVIHRNAQRRETNRRLERVGFVVAGTLPIVTPARAHRYFGG
jgi:hypothetical protein